MKRLNYSIFSHGKMLTTDLKRTGGGASLAFLLRIDSMYNIPLVRKEVYDIISFTIKYGNKLYISFPFREFGGANKCL